MADGGKDPDAFLTIGELSKEIGVAQHILRYWETRFPQLKPMQRAGNRRYYRPEDVALARRINTLLNEQGYTVRGVQKVLRDRNAPDEDASAPMAVPHQIAEAAAAVAPEEAPHGIDVFRLIALRDRLKALVDD